MKSKNSIKWFKQGLLLGSTTILVAACGNSNDAAESGSASDGEDGRTTLEFWSFWGSGARRETIEEIIEEYNTSQDEVTVEHVYQPWGDIWTKSLAAIAGGNAPDVIVQDINSVKQRAEAQQATNIQEYLDEEDISGDFYPQLWDTVLYEDEAYALPFNTDTQVLFYNKTAFEEAGLDPETPPATWDELEEMARQLDQGSEENWDQIGFYPRWNIGADVWALNADGGESWFDSNGEIAINTPEKVEALDWMLDWQDYYGRDTINQYEAEFGSGVSDPFISGLVAMRGQNINYYSNLMENAPDDFEYGVAPLPEKEEGSGHWSWGGGFVLEVPKNTEHPEESYDFMKYLSTTEVQEKFGMNSFDIMANVEANESLKTHEELDEMGHRIYELADSNLAVTTITPVPLNAPDYSSLVNTEIDAAFLGQKTAQEALDDAQESVENLAQ